MLAAAPVPTPRPPQLLIGQSTHARPPQLLIGQSAHARPPQLLIGRSAPADYDGVSRSRFLLILTDWSFFKTLHIAPEGHPSNRGDGVCSGGHCRAQCRSSKAWDTAASIHSINSRSCRGGRPFATQVCKQKQMVRIRAAACLVDWRAAAAAAAAWCIYHPLVVSASALI